MITDPFINKDGKSILKVSLLYINGNETLCDGCDTMKKCAVLNLISRDTTHLCKGCLTEIVNAFDTSEKEKSDIDMGHGKCMYTPCDRFATKDYNRHNHWVCDYHYDKLNDEFDEEYD